MHFKKLELLGFKSFCDKTTLHFEPGITAVVGPNGTGKSNIFDSIRWVLGEQSIKELRGSQSQDVIFNGSDSKEPLSMAEVTLTFDNHSKYFNLDHPEVAITRRLFRSGESEYLLNKSQVRLKDILDILLGTGIGAESYSLIQQGKIDLVLSSRPEDRRLVFDEASGITKYKAQKREALRKLEETEQNLLRVNDIIIEVKRQIGSLERQANKARRYKEVFEELKSKEISLALVQKGSLGALKDKIVIELEELGARESMLLGKIIELEAKIATRKDELSQLQEGIAGIKEEIMNQESSLAQNSSRIVLNQERMAELEARKKYLLQQEEQAKNRLIQEEEKLKQHREEYALIEQHILQKAICLKEKEEELSRLSANIKISLENIARGKKEVLEFITRITAFKNNLADLTARQQVHLARKKRLGIEKLKVDEEKAVAEEVLGKITEEVKIMEKEFSEINLKISEIKQGQETEEAASSNIIAEIADLEKEGLSLSSEKEFVEKLNTEFEGIGESLNAVIYLDKLPQEKAGALVVKLKERLDLSAEDNAHILAANFKVAGEAKPIDLDTDKVKEKINQIQQKIDSLKLVKKLKDDNLAGLKNDIIDAQGLLRKQEMVLIDKKALHKNTEEQFNKIKEEDDIINLELSDVEKELSAIGEELNRAQTELAQLENGQKSAEDLISREQNNISFSNSLKEEAIVVITQTKTEKDSLAKRLISDQATLKILDDSFNQNKENLLYLALQIKEADEKALLLEAEIKELEEKITETKQQIQIMLAALKEKEAQYQSLSEDSGGVTEEIDQHRKELDELKNKLYELQMQNKDLDFKYLSIKERLLQGYKTDLDVITDAPPAIDEALAAGDIQKLKEKLDSYGTVNLVAIEEYDELKKRYDFLTQQQNDLLSAKDSLHNAILKINRTTKQMFLETFEKVRLEFRNYFRLLFNGGDAQLFLVDEQDPLESGIEIICRPPGKKLQNVLLLSGGEKSLSAIALIFAIFKVKPAPFCVLDEIDAALDEANVDRFSRMLHEFAQTSQFIVITHNKRTIANADIMYGITMQESGVSKIVSVKFAQDKKPQAEKETDLSPVA